MYKKLLFTAGGGIISRNQQSSQVEAATIAIGLGGTGISCLRELKKQVYNKLKPDDVESAVPEYKHIKFLAVDTDVNSLGDDGSIDSISETTEYFDISCNNIHKFLANKEQLKNKPYFDWLKISDDSGNNGLTIQNAKAGAGGVRQIGRMLLLQNSKAFSEKMASVINAAKRDLPGDADINILIFTGLGGGTGSGIFLDVCYIINHVLKSINLFGQAQVCGFFFMPDINIDKIKSPDVCTYVRANGFAAMKELDYCMNFTKNGDKWHQKYDGFEITTSEIPVDLAHLVTATDSNGLTRTNGYDYAMHAVADYVMEFLTKPYNPAPVPGVPTPEPITLKGHIANIERIVEVSDKSNGGCYKYCVIGASNYYVPYKEINTYLTSKIFESFKGINEKKPTENDLQQFIHVNGLKFEDITRELGANIGSIPLREVDHNTLYNQSKGISPDVTPQILSYMGYDLTAVQGKVETNKKALVSDGEGSIIDSPAGIKSLISRIKAGLKSLASDIMYGPYYATAFLRDINVMSLDNVVDGYIERCKKMLVQERANLGLREDTISTSLNRLQSSNLLNRKKRAKDYTSAINSYYLTRKNIYFYSQLNELLDELKEQMAKLYRNYYRVLTDVISEIKVTFETNLRDLSDSVTKQYGYSKQLMSIPDLKGSLDRSVREMQLTKVVKGFFEMMMDKPEIWDSRDENKICRAVSDHFLSELGTYTSKTIIDYLQIKFDTNNPTELSKKIHDSILIKAYDEATPLFWGDSTKYSPSILGYCSVPESAKEIKVASDKLEEEKENLSCRLLEASDSISVLEFFCAVPMFAYLGTPLYFDTYINSGASLLGKHIYEGDGGTRNFAELPDITPCTAAAGTEFAKFVADRKALYEKAKELGIVYTDGLGALSNCYLKKYDRAKVDDFLGKAKSVKTAQEAKGLLNDLAEEIPLAETITINSSGTKDYYENIICDNVTNSLPYMDIVKDDLVIYSQYTEAKNSLVGMINDEQKNKYDVQNFANAYSSGIILKDINNPYNYYYETAGILGPEKHILTDIDSEPYGEKLPLYSAFVGYSKLNSEEKENITQLVKSAKVKSKEIVDANILAVNKNFDSSVDSMTKTIAVFYPENQSELIDFVKKIKLYI